MNERKSLCAILVSLLIAVIVPQVFGIDMSPTIFLDRYTVLDDGSLQHDTGHLIGKGVFQVIATEIVDPLFVDSSGLSTFVPISGKPIMDATLFDSYHAERLIPKWVRSELTYQIGFESFVTVMPKGFKPVTITIARNVQGFKVGKSAKLSATVRGTSPLSYQWYFNPVLDDNGDYNAWILNFVPISNATKKLCTIPNFQAENAGMYFVVVHNGLSSATSGFLGVYLKQ